MNIKKRITILVMIGFCAFLLADPPSWYYTTAEGQQGTSLRNALHNRIDNHNSLGYQGAKEYMFGYLDNENGHVMCVYTGQNYSIPIGGMPDQNTFNCEHSWAQSWFGTSEATTKKADLHHLFPTFASVNSARGNLPFDMVEDVDDTYGSNGYYSYRGDNENGVWVFEPADQHKGDLARAMLYFAVRYQEDIQEVIQDMGFNNVDMLSSLLEWNLQDPVSDKEIERNEGIYDEQNNRNPFVDHPEFANLIWNMQYGDLDWNNEVLAIDASLCLQGSLNLIELSSWQELVADVDGNGLVQAFDASLILQYAIHLINEFPVE